MSWLVVFRRMDVCMYVCMYVCDRLPLMLWRQLRLLFAASTARTLVGLEKLLRLLARNDAPVSTIVALSYHGFWTSRGRPSEQDIALDATVALNWVLRHFSQHSSSCCGAKVSALAVLLMW